MQFCRVMQLTDVSVAEDAPLPTEFRLLRAGVNETRNGTVLFDAEAATQVMREASVWGVDLVIDLEHDSLSEQARWLRNNAADAMGWFRLALREGELWAVNVTWTPEGERRLRTKLQRYVSPAFEITEEGRPTWMINVALCSMPATHEAVPLVAATIVNDRKAASAVRRLGVMDPELIQPALDALIAGDAAAALDILKNLIASAAGADSEGAPSEAPDATAEAPDAPPEDMALAAEGVTALAALRRITGRTELREAIAELTAMRGTVAALAAERDAALLTERRDLVSELVRLGVEYPSTAWAGDASLRNPVARLSAEPIEGLRSRVAVYRANRPAGVAGLNAQPQESDGFEDDTERRLAASMTTEQRARYMALRASRRAS